MILRSIQMIPMCQDVIVIEKEKRIQRALGTLKKYRIIISEGAGAIAMPQRTRTFIVESATEVTKEDVEKHSDVYNRYFVRPYINIEEYIGLQVPVATIIDDD